MDKKLTLKQERFVQEFLKDLNRTQAAIRAGYSPASARVIAQETLLNPAVQEAIQEALEKRAERCRIDGDQVLQELAKVAFANPRNVAKWSARTIEVRNSEDLDENTAAAVQEITQYHTKKGSYVKVKLYDKLPALIALARHLNLLNPEFRKMERPVEINIYDAPAPPNPEYVGTPQVQPNRYGQRPVEVILDE